MNTLRNYFLEKWGTNMKVSRALRALCVNLKQLMEDLFGLRESNRTVHEKYKLKLTKSKRNQVSFSCKSLRVQRPKIFHVFSLTRTYVHIGCNDFCFV